MQIKWKKHNLKQIIFIIFLFLLDLLIGSPSKPSLVAYQTRIRNKNCIKASLKMVVLNLMF